jgi:hypothetical protein
MKQNNKMMFFNQAIEFHGAEAVFFAVILFYACAVAIALALAGIADLIYGA